MFNLLILQKIIKNCFVNQNHVYFRLNFPDIGCTIMQKTIHFIIIMITDMNYDIYNKTFILGPSQVEKVYEKLRDLQRKDR